ncbi:MAG: hypothetical protein V3U65_15660, partial [Granulosicoccaceae bacterium]
MRKRERVEPMKSIFKTIKQFVISDGTGFESSENGDFLAPNRDNKADYDFFRSSALICSLLVFPAAAAFAATKPVTGITTSAVTATPGSYTGAVDGQSYAWGSGNDTILNSVDTASGTIISAVSVDTVTVRRVDNPSVSGNRCSIFAERSTSNNRNLQPTLSCDYSELLAGNIINIGLLDIFANVQTQSYNAVNNIERIDFVYFSGLVAPSTSAELAESGFLATEKSGNNPMVMAAITGIDGAGTPTSYGNLVKIWPASTTSEPIRYGIVPGTSTPYSFLADGTAPAGQNDQPELLLQSSESLGMAVITLDDLGINTGQAFYGFSYFSQDIYGTAIDPVDYQSFPTDTSGSGAIGDADIYGGIGAYFSNTPPPPANTDADSDGLLNTLEIGADPSNPIDSDNDGIYDYQEIDSDGDGILDAFEAGADPSNPTDSDNDGVYDYQETDSDGDGILDAFEVGSDPSNPTDSDNDGVYDYQEIDSDGDGIQDTLEAGADPTNPIDSDNDGVYDYQETDSDGDGILDALE